MYAEKKTPFFAFAYMYADTKNIKDDFAYTYTERKNAVCKDRHS